MWMQEQMRSLKDFLRWYNNINVVPALEAIKKWLPFTLTKVLICWRLVANSKSVVGAQYVVFPREAIIDETFIGRWTNLSKSVFGIDASHWDPVAETGIFTPRQNKTRSFETMAMSHCQRTTSECKIESFYTTHRQKRTDCFSVEGNFPIATLCSKQWVALTTIVPVKMFGCLLLKKIFNLAIKRENSMIWDEAMFNKNSLSLKFANVRGGDCIKQIFLSKSISERFFHTDFHLQLSN